MTSERVWRWVRPDVVFAIHDRQIAEHGGSDGIRDLGAIESALSRPQILAYYGDPDAAGLAAAYAFGLLKNHGFVDGNKRISWVTARLFLADNGFGLSFDQQDAIKTVEGLAGSVVSEKEFAAWLRNKFIT